MNVTIDYLVSPSMMCKSLLLAATTATLLFVAFFSDGAYAVSCALPQPQDLNVDMWEYRFGEYPFPTGFSIDEVIQAFDQAVRQVMEGSIRSNTRLEDFVETILTSTNLPWSADEATLRDSDYPCLAGYSCENGPFAFARIRLGNVEYQQVPTEEILRLELDCDGSASYDVYVPLNRLKSRTQTTFTSADLIVDSNSSSVVVAKLFNTNNVVTTTTSGVRYYQTPYYEIKSIDGVETGIFLEIGHASLAAAQAGINPTTLKVKQYYSPPSGSSSRTSLFSQLSKDFENVMDIFQANLPYSFGSSTVQPALTPEKGSSGESSPPSKPRNTIPTTDSDSSSSDGGVTSTGLIVGIVCGVIAAVAVVAAIGLFINKRKRHYAEPNFGSSAIDTQEPPIVAIHPPPPPLFPQLPTAMPELPSKSPLLPSDLPPPSMLSSKSTTASNNTNSMAKSPFMDSMLNSTNSQIKNDPILSWVVASGMAKSDVTTTSNAGGGRAISDRSGSSGTVDIRPWQLPFDDLSIIKVVGEGSFGRVYLAAWHETNVAVKVLLDNSVTQSQAATLSLSSPILQKLEAEGSLLASLRHPNIVNFMGVCTFPPAIVTEYCPRGSLTDVLKMAKENAELAQYLTWPRRIAMLTDAAQGMLFLHKHRPPIIHRDLKSPNLLVTEHFKVQISDFNLSKIIEEATASSAAQQISNSGANNPRWLAVECLSGDKATKASDVFSFGIIMWEVMTFSIPWTGQTNPWSIVKIICDGGRLEIPAKSDVPGGADTKNYSGYDGYVALMNKCWAQEPANRPDFAAVVAALKRLPA